MSSPRHLWSGDWRTESITAAEELARRRAAPQPIDDDPAPVSEPGRAGIGERLSAALARCMAALRRQLMALPRYLAALARSLAAAVASCMAWVRAHREQVRVGLLAALITLCTAAAAYGVLSLINRSSGNSATIVGGTQGWLGIEMASATLGSNGFPSSGVVAGAHGVVITDVVPGGPAAAAGLDPGDVLTQIDGVRVKTPAGVQAALSGLPVGEQVQLQYVQGSIVYMTQATLSQRPAGSP